MGAEATAQAAPAAEFFGRLRASFDTAARLAGGSRDHDLGIGLWGVRMRFAGPELEPAMLTPLRHLLGEHAPSPQAEICLFDSASTGVPVPKFAWRPMQLKQRGEVEGFNDERFRTIYHGDLFADDGGFQALSMYDDEARTAIFWVLSLGHLNWWERAEPLRPALNWTLAGPGRYLAHAACVADGDGAVLLAGKGGSGKTTTTVACLEDGFSFISDNYALIELGDGPSRAYSLYCNAKMRPGTLDLLPAVERLVATRPESPEQKFTIDLARSLPERLVTGVPVRALVVPEVVGHGETRLVPTSSVGALLALAPTTVYQLPGNGGVLREMADFVRTIPTLRLELGGDVHDGPRVLRRLLAEA